MAQYSYFRRTGTNLKTAGVSPQVAWYGIATMRVQKRRPLLIPSHSGRRRLGNWGQRGSATVFFHNCELGIRVEYAACPVPA